MSRPFIIRNIAVTGTKNGEGKEMIILDLF